MALAEKYANVFAVVGVHPNSAVEAAVDLAAYRSAVGTKIVGWRDNIVTLVIRGNCKGDLRLGNKMMVHECIDEGKINVYFGAAVKEITETEVVLIDARERDPLTAKEKARIKNDYVFVLIGGDKPTKFLESIPPMDWTHLATKDDIADLRRFTDAVEEAITARGEVADSASDELATTR